MTLEHAVLEVIPGAEEEFGRALAEAKTLIAGSPGFVRLEVHRCVETPHRHLLLVWWEQLEDHTIGFRGSDAYARWSALLHRFYDPFPTVEYFRLTDSA